MVSKPVSSQRFLEVHLAARQYGSKYGVPSVPFSTTEYQALTQKFKHTLIAKFQVGRPPLESVKQFMLSNWKIEGRVTITNNWDDRHIVVLLDSERDVQSALTCPWRKVGHTMSLVSSFINFLDIDTRTKEVASLSYARACVELDVSKEIPSKWINLPGDRGFFQDVIIEGNIAYCQRCKLHGHDVATCRKLARAQTKKDSIQKEGENIINIVSKIGMNDPVMEQEWQIVNRKKKGNEKMEDVVQPLKEHGDNVVAKERLQDSRPISPLLPQLIVPQDGNPPQTGDPDVETLEDVESQSENEDVHEDSKATNPNETTVEEREQDGPECWGGYCHEWYFFHGKFRGSRDPY
ncbi:hypothetical protein QQ045_026309 [Rhodiola kirilowii]